MTRYTRTASFIIAIALLAAVLTQSAVFAAPRTPEQVMQQATQVVVGGLHVCALMLDGSVMCWGNNETGQIGNSGCYPRCQPMSVQGLAGKVIKLSTGEYTTCAIIESDGSVMCWGDQYGYSATPIQGFTDATNVQNACALTLTGDVWCWAGSDCVDSLTNATLVLQNASSISSDEYNMCAITKDNSVKCMGDNEFGQLGNDKVGDTCTPLDVFNPFPYSNYIPAIGK